LIQDTISLILASASPRRRLLLQQIGLDFRIHPSNADESLDPSIPPAEHVTILSQRKAADVAENYEDALIVSADTIVVLDKEIITKPVSKADAIHKLTTLSGNCHEVFTGYTIRTASGETNVTKYESTEVWFRDLEEKEIERYVESGSPMDKAGAYGIQDDFGAVFIKKIHGDYYNVVGLPLCSFYQSLNQVHKDIQRRNGLKA
jgi:nucleoside triphosphate pyrophosphatase